MRNIFFVDSENVGDSWIQLFDYLNDDDCILVFYTDKSPNMSYANVVALKQSPFEPEFILCENGTDNALDFQQQGLESGQRKGVEQVQCK